MRMAGHGSHFRVKAYECYLRVSETKCIGGDRVSYFSVVLEHMGCVPRSLLIHKHANDVNRVFFVPARVRLYR